MSVGTGREELWEFLSWGLYLAHGTSMPRDRNFFEKEIAPTTARVKFKADCNGTR